MNGPIEPSADMRAGAKQLRQMYIALVAEGFTVPEALQIIGMSIAAAVQAGGDQ